MVDTSNSAALRIKISFVLPELLGAGAAIVTHPRARALYPEYLFAIHSMIRASVPLMEAALARARASAAEDEVAAMLAQYLAHHIPEERHHDDWLLDDLAALGFDRAALLRRQPSPTVAALVGAQYYWIFHYHPVALLGYIGVLEGYPPSVEGIEEIRRRTGYPAKAFTTMLKHARLDPHHRDDLNEFLDRLPLTAEQAALVGLNAIQTVHGSAAVLREVVARQPPAEPERPAVFVPSAAAG